MARPTIIAIGDSLTQGFQHGALHRPQWSYPAILARALGLEVPRDHPVPTIRGPGYPLNIDDLLRNLSFIIGDDIALREWVFALPRLIPRYFDAIEDYYERGSGSRPAPHDVYFHNLANWGVTVNEATTLTPRTCSSYIEREEGRVGDDLLGIPSAPMFRAARTVLNPACVPSRDDATVLDNLRALAEAGPIDTLIVWLGANDCLGTVLELELREMPTTYDGMDPFARRAFNLTSVKQFRRDYRRLVGEIDVILARGSGRRQVYVGTVPHVTIPPVTNGIGTRHEGYFDRYVRFFLTNDNAPHKAKALTRDQAMRVDARIDDFNAVIRELADAAGWTIVDTATMLAQLSVERNACSSEPGKPLRDYLESRGYTDHPLLALDPIPTVDAYAVAPAGEDGHRRVGGGLFSLDHIHPSTLGYGLAAERFLEAIQAQNPDDPEIQAARIDWPAVIAHDTLEQTPPALWNDLMANPKPCEWLWEQLVSAMVRRVI